MNDKTGYPECLCYVNKRRAADEYRFCGSERRDVYSLHYVVSGRGKVIIDGVEYGVEAGQSFIIYPYTTAVLMCDKNDPWEYKSIEIRALELSQNFAMTAFGRNNPVTPPLPKDIFEKAFDVVEGGNETDYQRCRSNARLLMLISYYMEYFPCRDNRKSNYVVKACEYIENNYRSTECSVKNTAEYVKLDRTYLYRLFKDEVGISVQEYINNFRITKAGLMLVDKRIAVKDVAFSVGFTDQMYFSKVFRKVKGCTPTEYRSRLKQM